MYQLIPDAWTLKMHIKLAVKYSTYQINILAWVELRYNSNNNTNIDNNKFYLNLYHQHT